MSTVIYPSPIFGPIKSRRLGISLGINLLPEDGKWCSFDCIYCECGFNSDHRARKPLPTKEEVLKALEERLKDMKKNGPQPDVLTFAGNGEPTLHPHFPEIASAVMALRDHYFPEAKISVLTNSTQIRRPEVLDALVRMDNPILKLDTIDAAYITTVDRPQGGYDVNELVSIMASVGSSIIIQTMFMGGEYEGKSVDNTLPEYVNPWLEAVRKIGPRQVMIYTIDRETPAKGLEKATHEQLDSIADQVRAMGIECSVSY